MGCDARANIILADSVEREFSEDDGVEMVPLGLYMIKGDNVYVIEPVKPLPYAHPDVLDLQSFDRRD
jgi:hypothetical protein